MSAARTASPSATVPYAGPVGLGEAIRLRGEHPDWLVLAGGTDVMVGEAERAAALGVLDVFGVVELHTVDAAAGTIRIGAGVTFAELLANDTVRDTLPLLWAAAGEVGAVQVRDRGTIGGNIVTSSPVGDMLPCLLALDATVVLASARGTRAIAYERFVRGYRSVELAADELLVAVEIARPAPGTVQHWRKVGARSAQAIAKVSIAAAARMVADRVVGFRLAFGGVADHPVRLRGVEEIVEGLRPDAALADRVHAAVRASLDPITDVRSTADYRRDVAANLAVRFVSSLPG